MRTIDEGLLGWHGNVAVIRPGGDWWWHLVDDTVESTEYTANGDHAHSLVPQRAVCLLYTSDAADDIALV